MSTQQRRSKLRIDWPGTKKIRSSMARQKMVKITINIDAGSLDALKAESANSGVPYQRILNSLLKESLNERGKTASRLDQLEREINLIKSRIAA